MRKSEAERPLKNKSSYEKQDEKQDAILNKKAYATCQYRDQTTKKTEIRQKYQILKTPLILFTTNIFKNSNNSSSFKFKKNKIFLQQLRKPVVVVIKVTEPWDEKKPKYRNRINNWYVQIYLRKNIQLKVIKTVTYRLILVNEFN